MDIIRHDAGARMSRVVEYGGVLYFCGHVARPEFTTMAEQTVALTERLDELFAQFGTDKDNMLMVNIYLKDIAMRDEMNAVWDKWVTPGKAPARCCVQAAIGDDNALLEITVIAAKKKGNTNA